MQSADVNAQLGLGTGSVTGATSVNVLAGQDAIVQVTAALPGELTVNAGRDATLSAPTVSFNAVQAGRDITLMTTDGGFTSTSAIDATRNLTIGATGALTLGDITAASGSISLTGASVTAGNVSAGQDLTLQATNGGVTLTSFKAGEDLTVQGSTLSLGQQLAPIGRDLTITTPGNFSSASSTLTAGRNLTLNVGGDATLQGLTVPGALDITAKDVTLTGAVSAASMLVDVSGVASLQSVTVPGSIDIIARDLTLTGGVTAANVQIESATGALQVGGATAPASGMWIDSTEFGLLHVTGQVNLYAGQASGSARGDLTVLDLNVNPTSTPQVNFLVGSGQNAMVEGLVAPTTSGGIIHIGDSANTAWQPNSILVSGEIGSATYSNGTYSNISAFDDVRLFAAQDIIIGSQRFISLIQSTDIASIDVGRNQPAGVAAEPGEQNRVLVAAGDLELSASGKVVSQNTGATPDQSVGLFLTGKPGATSVTPDLIIDPPALVDLYGSFVGPSGAVVSSFSAGMGVAYSIVDSTGAPTTAPVGAVYRFDSCAIGTSQCSAATSVTSNLAQTTPILTTPSISGDSLGGAGSGSDSSGDSSDSSSSGGSSGGKSANRGDRNSGPPLLQMAPVEADQVLVDPVVTGAGSEEIWRKHKPDPTPDASDKTHDQGAKP